MSNAVPLKDVNPADLPMSKTNLVSKAKAGKLPGALFKMFDRWYWDAEGWDALLAGAKEKSMSARSAK